MAHIKRYLEEKISENLKNRKILIIYGPRQAGKTTLVRKFLNDFSNNAYLNGDLLDDQDKLKDLTHGMIDQFSGKSLLVIDEAQRVLDIGMKLKVIFDALPKLKIIATGSSAFELANKVNEPLTGRYFSFIMYPISLYEMQKNAVPFNINELLVYGSYPEVVTAEGSDIKERIIKNIASNYLFKDLLNIEYIKNPRSLEYLLKALALQVGGEVSMNELANTLNLDMKTVASYMDILEKLYIIFPLHPFYTNKRKSITKLRKYYFYDLGIRNSILNDFTPVEKRADIGALWENFCIAERMKRNDAIGRVVQYYFWRSYKGDEIDLLEVRGTEVRGFECKWKNTSLQKKIKDIYSEDLGGLGDLQIIFPGNVPEFAGS